MTYFSHLLILKSSIDLSCNCGMIACDKNQSFHLRWEQQERWLSWQRKSKDKLSWGISEKWDPRPGTIGGTQDPRPSTLNVGPETWDPERIFRKFSQFFLKSSDYELIHVLFAFVCFSLPYHTAYALLIFYHLNVLLFRSYCKNFHHAAAMKSLNFRENQW